MVKHNLENVKTMDVRSLRLLGQIRKRGSTVMDVGCTPLRRFLQRLEDEEARIHELHFQIVVHQLMQLLKCIVFVC